MSLSTTSTTVTSQQATPSISTSALVSGAGVSSGGLKLSSEGLNIGTGTLPSNQRTFMTSTSSISTVQSMPNLNVSLPSLTPIATPTVTTCASQGIQLSNLLPSMTTSQPAAHTNVTSILTNPIPAFSGASSTTGLIPTSVTQSLSLNLQPSTQPQGLNIGTQSATSCSTLSLVKQSGGLGSGLKLSNTLSLSQSGTQSGGTNPRLLTGLKIPNLTNPTSIQSQMQSTSLFQSNLIDKPVVTSTSSLALNSVDTQSANIFRLSSASGSSQANSMPTAQSVLSAQPTINSSVPSIAKSSGNFQFSLSNNTAFNFSTNQQNSTNPLGANKPLFGSASNGSQVTQSGLTLNKDTQQQTQAGGLQFGLGSYQQAQSSGFQVGIGSQQQSQSSGLQFGIGSQQIIQQQPQSGGLQFGSGSQQKQPQSNGLQFGVGSQQQPQTSGLKFGNGSQSSGLLFGTGTQQQSQIQAGSSLQQGSGLQFGAGFQQQQQQQQQQQPGGLQFGMPQSSQSGGLNFPSLSQQPLQFNLGSQQQQKQEGLQFNTGVGGVQQTGFQFNSNSQQQKTGGLFQSFQQQQQQPATGLQFNTSQPQNATPNSGLLFNQQSSTKNTALFGGGGTQTSNNPGIFSSGPQTSAASNVFNPMSKPSFNFQQGSTGPNNSGNTLLFNQSSGQTGFNGQPNQLQIGQTNSIFPSGPQQTSALPSFGGNQLANQSPFQFGTPGNQPGNLAPVGSNAPFSANFNFVNNKTPQNVTPQPSNQGFNFSQGNMTTPNTMNFSAGPSRPTATRRRGGLRKK